MLRSIALVLLLSGSMALGQAAGAVNTTVEKKPLASFEVATIKPVDPNRGGALGFYSRPGGRVFLGFAPVTMILQFAFNIQSFQISGGPGWAGMERYNITAVPPESSASRTAVQPPIAATPTEEQREMLQSLLRDRFKLQYHWEKREGTVYLLTRGSKPLQLKAPEHPEGDSRGTVVRKPGGIADGQAFGENVTISFLAGQLGALLNTPVIDQTGLSGHYDFDLPPSDPDNHDITVAVFDAMDRLGLKLKHGRGPVDILVIDHVDHPSEN